VTIGGVSGTFTITTLLDTVPPVLSLVGGNITLSTGQAWSEPGYSATDNADGSIPPQRLSVSGTVNTAVPGEYILTYSATDLAGNVGTTTRTVTVVQAPAFDAVAPLISIIGGNRTLTVGDTWTDPGATAIDAVDGSVAVVASGTVNTGIPGVYSITYTAEDQAGNIGTATRLVSVVRATIYPLTTPAPASRTLVFGSAARLEAGGGYFFKQPAEVLDYDIDLTTFLDAEDDAIIPGSIQVSATGLVIEGAGQITGTNRIKSWVSGGANGTANKIEITITTTGYRTFQFEMLIVVVDR
jgi:hypothetical protein